MSQSTSIESAESPTTSAPVFDVEKSASAGGVYVVSEHICPGETTQGLKTTKDGTKILIPQPSNDINDPLNWSWMKKHSVLFALLLPSLLTDWGMTWGTTLFEAQAATWHVSVVKAATSVSGGIFLQGPGGLFVVPIVERYGRLPVLFWSQLITLALIIGASFSPGYASFTACRTLQGFFGTAPQVIGLAIVHDMFFFHEHAVKVNIWATCFVLGPYLGPFISSWLIAVIAWRPTMVVLAGFYALSVILVVLFGRETLYKRSVTTLPTLGSSRISVLIGYAGAKARDQTRVLQVVKNLARLSITPQLLLPSLFIFIQFTWVIGIVITLTQFIRPPPYLLSSTGTSLMYLAPIIGSIIGQIWGHFVNDYICNRYIRTHNGVYDPESRLWAVYPGIACMIIGLVTYGQVLEHHLDIMGLAVALAIVTFAAQVTTTAISAYALDCFPKHAALASSWINFWRTTGGFCVAYFQMEWVAASGAAVTFGCQAAIVAAASFLILATHIKGKSWRTKFPPPDTQH